MTKNNPTTTGELHVGHSRPRRAIDKSPSIQRWNSSTGRLILARNDGSDPQQDWYVSLSGTRTNGGTGIVTHRLKTLLADSDGNRHRLESKFIVRMEEDRRRVNGGIERIIQKSASSPQEVLEQVRATLWNCAEESF